ncbi:type II 3-dehydroquinate dehydratase [Myroides guanonis]|uniref:3-dehydroquinate dehydratase n=1 Tax=Myroides guanonis TaxID=1150112 RepID=A0A1I3UM09_9FLAO|nr:type II 3-dehydroquinate dehydratase [Myroides guanonis]SFJ82946.1 3-dehydroquinate dehydratase [Myroides guanonis]
MKIAILNGPNLNLLGKREPSIYGYQSFDQFFLLLKEQFPQVSFTYFQSNHEGELIDSLHKYGFEYDGIILNAGAYTHTSIAIADAISAIESPVIEVHISNVHSRESFRSHSYIAAVCKGSISGFGLNSYTLALQSFLY